jgi:hypothetical protein
MSHGAFDLSGLPDYMAGSDTWFRNRGNMSTHPGIQVRISIPAGPILEGDSDHLHWLAKYRGVDPCPPSCLPSCREHGWSEIIPGQEMPLRSTEGLRIEIRPVDLPDYVPDDEAEHSQ